MGVAREATEPRVYELKVTLEGSAPAIWRRIRVPGDVTLARLHRILQTTMGWGEMHHHQFVIRGRCYGRPDREGEVQDERRVRLAEVVRRAGSRFIYEYDFDDGWVHDVRVERILSAEEGTQAPACLAGERACPPEDVGGMYGYYDVLALLQNGRSAGHERAQEWIGERFDPDAFDVETVNRRLGSVRKRPEGATTKGTSG